jgi:ribonuclease HI
MTDRSPILIQLGVSARVSQAGWSWLRVDGDGATASSSGAEPGGTAWRARLIAAADALLAAPPDVPIEVHTGDETLAQVATTSLPRWKAADWQKKGGIQDLDVVKRLYAALEGRDVRWSVGDPASPSAVAAQATALAAGKSTQAAAWAEPVASTDDVEVLAWTDGGCRKNPGPGGWGFVMVHLPTGTTMLRRGGEADTTNNRMELTSLLQLLEAITRPGRRVEVRADSKYVIDTATKWMASWKRKGWTRGRDEQGKVMEVKNLDLVKALDAALTRHDVRFTWVRGHSGDAGNELADKLCNDAMDDVARGRDPAHTERRPTPPFKLNLRPTPR